MILFAACALFTAAEMYAVVLIVRVRRRRRTASARLRRRIVNWYGRGRGTDSGREPQARPATPLAATVSEAAAASEPPSRPELPYPSGPLASRRVNGRLSNQTAAAGPSLPGVPDRG